VNRCPLDEGYPNQFVDRNDKERRCTMEKAVRVRIATTEPSRLAMSGLTATEHAAALAYERKPVAVKLAMVEMGKASLAKLHTSNKLKIG
jgi:hypothetical protein